VPATAARIVAGLAGAVVAIGSAALPVEGRAFSGPNRWCAAGHVLLAATDILGSSCLVGSAVRMVKPAANWVVPGALAVAAAHIYGNWAYLAWVPHPSCGNLPLVVLDNVRLLALLAMVATACAAVRRGQSHEVQQSRCRKAAPSA
jgi:hypothetical protein